MTYRIRSAVAFTFFAALHGCAAPEPIGEVAEGLRIVPGDTCATAPTLMPGPSATFISGSTIGRADDYGSSTGCGDKRPSSSPDVAVKLNLAGAGVLKVQVNATGTTWRPEVYLRDAAACDVEAMCWSNGYTGQQFAIDVPTPSLKALIVDSYQGGAGTFSASVSYAPPACGDGVLSPGAGEQCDDGGTVGGDGCSAECQFEASNSSAETLPGEALPLAVGSVLMQTTTIGYADDITGTCAAATGGRDRVWDVTPGATGTLTVKVGLDADDPTIPPSQDTITCQRDSTDPGCWDYVLCAYDDGGASLGCVDDFGAWAETLSLPVAAGQHVHLVLDGYDDGWYSSGPAGIRFTLQ